MRIGSLVRVSNKLLEVRSPRRRLIWMDNDDERVDALRLTRCPFWPTILLRVPDERLNP